MDAPQDNISVECMLSFLEYLTIHRVSVHMVANYVSTVKAMASVYGLNVKTLDDKRIKYFITVLKVNRPLAVVKRNVMDIHTLKQFIQVFRLIAMQGYIRPYFYMPSSASSGFRS